MQIKISPIHTDEDLGLALDEVAKLMELDPELGTPEGDKLDILVTLIEAYERKNFPIGLPDPIEAIKFRMDQSGLSIADLVPMIGNANRVYEVLNKKRPLTLRMIRNLNQGLGLPAQALIS